MEENQLTTPLPLVAIIGLTNVGKSTLFNRITNSHLSVTAREPSTTRDTIFGEVHWQNCYFNVVDTAGLTEETDEITRLTHEQMEIAKENADLILFVFEGKLGLDQESKKIVSQVRQLKPIFLIANKIDTAQIENSLPSYDYLNLPVFPISALNGRGVGDLLSAIIKTIPCPSQKPPTQPIIAIIGRPNVGKSTLLNALTGQNRAIVSPQAGTTRDLVSSTWSFEGKTYLLVDSAGVRRRKKIQSPIEKFSIKRTLTLIEAAAAVIVLLDAREGLARGDLHLIYFAAKQGKPVLIAYNKSDLLETAKKSKRQLDERKFPQVLISAQKNVNLDLIRDWIHKTVSS